MTVEGAYVALTLLSDVMARTGVDLAREGLRRVLDTRTFRTGLTSPIRHGPRSRGGVRCMRAYEIRYRGTFEGWVPAPDRVCAQ